MDTLSQRLEALECPVNWNLQTINEARSFSPKMHLIDKLNVDVFEGKSSSFCWRSGGESSTVWQKFSQWLALTWLEYPQTEKMRRCLAEIDKLIKNEEAQMLIPLITRYINALKYVVNSMWAHVYYKENNIEIVEDYLRSLVFDEMENKEKAAIMALKACVLMEFGPLAHHEAYTAINEALKLEDNQAEWHFLKGKCIARTRRSHNHRSAPSDEELYHLRKAVEMDQGCASHYVFCAQSVKEYALYSKEAQYEGRVKDEHMGECEELMREAARLGTDSPIILTRIAKGLMSSNNVADLVEHCVHRSLELLPDSGLVNHVAGNYFEFVKNDKERAIFHLEIAALEKNVFGAYINLIQLKWRTSTEDIEPIVNSFWRTYRNDSFQRIKAVPVIAAFNFFVKNDLVRSADYWREWMLSQQGQHSDSSLFVKCSDLTIPLVGEVQSVLNSTSSTSPDDEAHFKMFLCAVLEARPGLDISKIKTNRTETIRTTLTKMDPTVRSIVEPKLPVPITLQMRRLPSSSRWGYRPPAGERAKASQQTKTRELPKNWREP